MFEISTCKSCFVSELNKNSFDLHKLVTGTVLFWDVAVTSSDPAECTVTINC